jgi:hypothetical protein
MSVFQPKIGDLHTYIHACIHTYILRSEVVCLGIYVYVLIRHAHINKCTYTQIHACPYRYTHTHTYLCLYTPVRFPLQGSASLTCIHARLSHSEADLKRLLDLLGLSEADLKRLLDLLGLSEADLKRFLDLLGLSEADLKENLNLCVKDSTCAKRCDV